MSTLQKNNRRRRTPVKFEIVEKPTFWRSIRESKYKEIIDALVTIEPHSAVKVFFKDFTDSPRTVSASLRKLAEVRKMKVSIMEQDDHVTVWRKVQI